MTKDIPKLIHWRELDILRGLAAVLMIINHVGYKTLAPNLTEGGLSGTLVFIGSFAPVLFFFVTLMGIVGLDFLVFSLLTFAVLATSFWMARSLEYAIKKIRKLKFQRRIFLVMTALLFLAINITVLSSNTIPVLATHTRTIGQFILCFLFAI